MTDLRKAAQIALDALETKGEHHERVYAAIEALRQALAQPANQSDCGHTEYKPFCQMCMATKQKHEGRITALEVRVAKLEKPMTDREKELLAGQRSLLRTAAAQPEQELVCNKVFKQWKSFSSHELSELLIDPRYLKRVDLAVAIIEGLKERNQ